MTTASIVIVTYGQREMTEQCLRSLEVALGDRLGHDWELVLVDNNSPDDTRELLAEWSDRASLILLDENRNFAGGCNAGAQAASGDVLLFLNNDTEVPTGALETLVEQARDPQVGAVGCRLLFPDRTVQHAGVAFISGKAMDHLPMPQHVFTRQPEALAATQATYEADCVTAACIAIPAELFSSLGGFDERYVNGLEDVDLCLRIRMAQRKILYRGDVTLIHHEGASRGRGKELFHDDTKLEVAHHNDELFVARWGRLLDEDRQLASEAWDATLVDPPKKPERTGERVEASVIGIPSGIGPWADEARAFLDLWSRRGLRVAAYNMPFVNVAARLAADELDQLRVALERRGSFDTSVYVPVAAADVEMSERSPVRVGDPQTVGDLSNANAVWAPCQAVADTLIDAGIAPQLISIVWPPLKARAAGAGGDGVLAVLPVQDLRLSAQMLSQLRRLGRRVKVTVLPTTYRRALASELKELLPHAQLLSPIGDERRFAELASQMDVVLAADPSDPFERRALVAASVGTAALTLRHDGPAAEILGDCTVTTAATVSVALSEALESGSDERDARRARVAGDPLAASVG